MKSKSTIVRKLGYLVGLALLLSVTPIRAISQTDDAAADRAERAKRKAAVNKAADDTKHTVKKGWHSTKRGVRKAYHATSKAVMKPINKAKAKHQAHEKAEGETK